MSEGHLEHPSDDRGEALLSRAKDGDREALVAVFTRAKAHLRRVISLRLDPRLRGRVDPSDVLQDAWLDIGRRFEDWVRAPDMPLPLWVRFLTVQKLTELHRRHLGAQRRDAAREVRLAAGPQATSVSIAEHLIGALTSPSEGAARLEARERLTAALESMDEVDREVLTLRHFEELTNNEVAEVLGITKAGASNRYVRALKRIREAMGASLGEVG